MQDSLQLMTQQQTKQEELQKQNVELVAELEKSKDSKEQFKTALDNMENNLKSLQKSKDEEIAMLAKAKIDMTANYDERITGLKGASKAALEKEKAAAMESLNSKQTT